VGSLPPFLFYRILFVVLLALLSARHSVAAPIGFTVTVNTSAVSGTVGFLDFQFNPGSPPTQAATAQIFNFTGGIPGATTPDNGNVSGTLPGTLTLMNSTPLNEYLQGFTFGSSFSFLLVLSGPAIDSPDGTSASGSAFALGMFDSGLNAILTNQGASSGIAAEVDINLNGTASATAFPSATGGQPAVTFQASPEPATMLLMALSMAGFLCFRRRWR
jgi:hypothetical protein